MFLKIIYNNLLVSQFQGENITKYSVLPTKYNGFLVIQCDQPIQGVKFSNSQYAQKIKHVYILIIIFCIILYIVLYTIQKISNFLFIFITTQSYDSTSSSWSTISKSRPVEDLWLDSLSLAEPPSSPPPAGAVVSVAAGRVSIWGVSCFNLK